MFNSQRSMLNHYAQTRRAVARLAAQSCSPEAIAKRYAEDLAEAESAYRTAVETVRALCLGTQPERVAEFEAYAEAEHRQKLAAIHAKYARQPA